MHTIFAYKSETIKVHLEADMFTELGQKYGRITW